MARAAPLTGRRAALRGIGVVACGLLVADFARAQPVVAGQPALPRIDDLQALAAQVRREKIPLLLFFSTPGCPYCMEVRRNYLAPRLKENAGSLLIREVEIGSRRTLVGPDGASLTEAELAERFKVRTVPAVQLVDADLIRLGRPLVGIDAAGFYEGYLSATIDQAQRALRAR